MSAQLAAKIKEHERQLEAMKQELEARNGRLNELHSKEAELQANLDKIRAEIAEMDEGQVEEAAEPLNGHAEHANGQTNGTAPKKRGRPKKVVEPEPEPEPEPVSKTRNRGENSLRRFILKALRGEKKPVPAKDIADKVKELGYETEAANFHKVVMNTLGGMQEVENEYRVGYRLK